MGAGAVHHGGTAMRARACSARPQQHRACMAATQAQAPPRTQLHLLHRVPLRLPAPLLRRAALLALLEEAADLILAGRLGAAARRRRRRRLCRLQLPLPRLPALAHPLRHLAHLGQHLAGHRVGGSRHRQQGLQEGQHVLRLLPPRQDAQALRWARQREQCWA